MSDRDNFACEMVLKPMELRTGDPFPWIDARTTSRPRFALDTAAGRYLVLCFFGTMADPAGRDAMKAMLDNRDLFDDAR